MVRRTLPALIALLAMATACNGAAENGETSLASTDATPPSTTTIPVPSTTAAPAVPEPTTSGTPLPAATEDEIDRFLPDVLSVRPHDPEAFTQGLLIEDGRLFESTGLYGRSTVREVDPVTGAIVRQAALDASLFGEGLELVGDRLVMLTYREGTALVFARDSFTQVGEFAYATEGWGLCLDGDRLVMSDGTARLVFRDPETFAEIGSVAVTLDGRPVERINELECVDGAVWANIWLTDLIYRIDPISGAVTGIVDAGGLLAEPVAREGAVLNGIAFDERTETWLLTGKLWPAMFEVRFEPVPAPNGGPAEAPEDTAPP